MFIRLGDTADGISISKDNELLAVGLSNVVGGIVDGTPLAAAAKNLILNMKYKATSPAA